jgi:hypothetical protein
MKKQLTILFILMVFSLLFWSSCTSEKLEPNCNTQNMSYSQNVVPILKSNCYKCHGSGNSVGSYGHLLDNYDTLTKYYTARTIPIVIVPGDTTLISALEGYITHTPGFLAMPYMDGKLDTCAIKQIQAWITQGFPNN